jgi:hypothetical protein
MESLPLSPSHSFCLTNATDLGPYRFQKYGLLPKFREKRLSTVSVILTYLIIFLVIVSAPLM